MNKTRKWIVPFSGLTFDVPEGDLTTPNWEHFWSGEKSLWDAASEGDIPTLQSFVEHDVDPDARNDEDDTPLMCAAAQGQNQTVDFLLTRGANINAANLIHLTPLMLAAENGHLETVKLLLERGADVNMRQEFFGNETTAAEIAARAGHSEIAKLLEQALT